MTKHKFLIIAFLPLFLFGDCADCEAYKTQVVNDCDSIISSCDSAYFDCMSAAASAEQFAVYYGSNSTERVSLTHAAESCYSAGATLMTLKTFAQSIKSTAQSLQCTTNTVGGSCDCAQYLQTLIGLVQTCNQTVAGISSGLDAVNTALGTPDATLPTVLQSLVDIQDAVDTTCEYLIEEFLGRNSNGFPHTLSDFYNLFASMANAITNSSGTIAKADISSLYVISNSTGPYNAGNSLSYWLYPFDRSLNSSTIRSLTLKNLFLYGFKSTGSLLASLNNYAYQDYLATGVSTNLLSDGFSSVTNTLIEQFSIFNDAVFSADAPLSMYTDNATDGSYHDYLTNYYIKVSKGQQSGSDNFTNWFSRIEILLASLVFQDDGTNFVDNSENTSQMENTLSQSVDTLSQAVAIPENVTGKIDNMGQSFLGLLDEWRTIVNGNSLPSQFVLCDINLSSQNRDSSAGSSITSFRLETSLDSGEFRQFLDFCHAITTILFTMLFVWLSMLLLSFLLGSLAKLAQFCYMVYSALFGG